MQVGFTTPMSLDGSSERISPKHPLIFRRGHEISGSGTCPVSCGHSQAFDRRRLPQSECASELVCHLQFKHRNTVAIFVCLPDAAQRTREPSMHSWSTALGSSSGAGPFRQSLQHGGVRSPDAGHKASDIPDRAGRGNSKMISKISRDPKSSFVVGLAFLLCDAKAPQAGGIRPGG